MLPGRRQTLYFAYGSNMAVRAMRLRCPGARLCGTAIVENFRFLINRHGFATVVPDRRRKVFGALWRVTAADLRALDAYEEVGKGLYAKRRIAARRPRGGIVSAIIYVAADADPGVPQRRYIRGIVESARRLKFPSWYLREISIR